MALSDMDTIVAAATPRGVSALAVVRLSGDAALIIADRVFSGSLSDVPSHTAHVGFVGDESGDSIDQVVATVFRAPASATGEDIVEFTCHGGSLAADALISALTASGARPAGPGEFTQRAFVNGKMDLTQAEAVADLIHARSSRAHRVSVSHLKGEYSRLLEAIREELLELVSLLELELDFSDEDVEFADRARLEALLEKGTGLIDELVGSFRFGRAVSDGITVAIGGKPNAGKSTLLNALLGFDRTIVSDIPGTTRDEVEAELEYDGWRLRFVDTAGIRETSDRIEAEGVRRARERFTRSDVLIYLFDATAEADPEEAAFLDGLHRDYPDLLVLRYTNKADLVSDGPSGTGGSVSGDASPPEAASFDSGLVGSVSSEWISATEAMRDAPMAERILRSIVEPISRSDTQAQEHRVVTSERHRTHLKRAQEALHRARSGLEGGLGGDRISADIRSALDEIGMITGRITNEDVLDQIFSRFCIGK